MNAKRPIAAGTIVLGLLAIATSAGFYGNRSSTRSSGGVVSGGSVGSGEQTGLPPWFIENLVLIIIAGSMLLFVVGAMVILAMHGREGARAIMRFMGQMAVFALGAVVFYTAVKLLAMLAATGPAEVGAAGGGTGGTPPGGGSSAPGDSGGGDIPLFVGLFGVWAIAGVIMYLMFKRDDDGESGAAPGGHGAVEPVDAGAEAPAEPQITIDDVPQSNAVYRAWQEMASRALDASQRTATPSEVASAAIRADLDHDAVRTLTDLFEEVRYGDRPVTDERERTANQALDALGASQGAGS